MPPRHERLPPVGLLPKQTHPEERFVGPGRSRRRSALWGTPSWCRRGKISIYYVSIGSRTPPFRTGFPSSFVQRLGRSSSEFHYTGTYAANDLTIGYLRIPSFSSLKACIAKVGGSAAWEFTGTFITPVPIPHGPRVKCDCGRGA